MILEINALGACLVVFIVGLIGYVYGRITTQKRCEKSFFNRRGKRNG